MYVTWIEQKIRVACSGSDPSTWRADRYSVLPRIPLDAELDLVTGAQSDVIDKAASASSTNVLTFTTHAACARRSLVRTRAASCAHVVCSQKGQSTSSSLFKCSLRCCISDDTYRNVGAVIHCSRCSSDVIKRLVPASMI